MMITVSAHDLQVKEKVGDNKLNEVETNNKETVYDFYGLSVFINKKGTLCGLTLMNT